VSIEWATTARKLRASWCRTNIIVETYRTFEAVRMLAISDGRW